ncbi:uncharacterized protein LOC107045724 isoform X2 [Diachasma alloeum]|uniref:uncharacterized protein LOC107045724 isoform X2 n=1 Tax=Diachasma alloeum TaxID=454923 RepID=UPI0007383B81|nr:uncharacterized protein LOC107045724 isoform X2 [Diachasma alloeum]
MMIYATTKIYECRDFSLYLLSEVTQLQNNIFSIFRKYSIIFFITDLSSTRKGTKNFSTQSRIYLLPGKERRISPHNRGSIFYQERNEEFREPIEDLSSTRKGTKNFMTQSRLQLQGVALLRHWTFPVTPPGSRMCLRRRRGPYRVQKT